MIKRWHFFRYRGLLGVLVIYLLITLILSTERAGIQVRNEARQGAGSYLSKEETITAQEAAADLARNCLVVRDSRSEDSLAAYEQFQQILLDMKIGYDTADLAEGALPDLLPYETCLVLVSAPAAFGEDILKISDWVRDGGRALFALTLVKDNYLSLIEQKLGIISSGYENVLADSFCPTSDFMLGGGEEYGIVDAFDSALSVELDETVTVYAATGGERSVPLVWSKDYGEGRFVIDNFGIYEKAVRGIYAASISLLTDICIWPVLDGAVFYLDDFPSPVPGGDGEYIRRDYSMSVAEFYTNVWWPDLITLAEKLGIRYTGVLIENYGDDTKGKIVRQEDTARFQYFGNMLLHLGGELGYHGYNHQPLCLGNYHFGTVLPYRTWPDEEQMRKAVAEMIEYSDEMFPMSERSVYVPPSNVISEEGFRLLTDEFPSIRTVASTYFPGEFAWTQEFGCTEDGMIEQPRTVSGELMGDYEKMVSLSELNMHMVFNHFMHPDDLLDTDRGAALGWEKLRQNLDETFTWLFDAAPALRRLTGSELSAEIQRWSAAAISMEMADSSLTLHIDNFFDEVKLMARFNEGKPVSAEGASLTPLTDSLYLIEASSDSVFIQLEKGSDQ